MTTSALIRFAAPTLLLALLLAGCSGRPTESADGDGGISIVASTNVYGDIAASIAGEAAMVTSFITSPAQDPHEYEASARDRLALDDADVVLKNGGGYDPFMDALLASGDAKPAVLDAVEISGLAPDEHGRAHVEGFNEHVWYNFGAMSKVAKAVGDELSELDPGHARDYAANVTAFTKSVDALERAEQRLRATAGGRGAAITEPVPMYLLEAVGLVNRTPHAFSEAIEEGADVSPRVLKETLGLFGGPNDIAVLAYSAQTADATTGQVRDAAKAAGVPVVDFTETLPHGKSYIAWQRDNLDRLAAALGKHG